MASQFVQILLGNLSVDLRDGDRCLRLDEDTLLTEASRIQGIDGRVPDAVKDLPQIANVTAAIRAREAYFSLRSEEHTSELQSLMLTSSAVFCLTSTTFESGFQYALSPPILYYN